VDHLAEEVGLPHLAEVGDADVRQRLLLQVQDLARVLDSLLLGDAGPRAPRPDDEGLVERRLDHLRQLGVVEVVVDVLEDVPGHIRKYAK